MMMGSCTAFVCFRCRILGEVAEKSLFSVTHVLLLHTSLANDIRSKMAAFFTGISGAVLTEFWSEESTMVLFEKLESTSEGESSVTFFLVTESSAD